MIEERTDENVAETSWSEVSRDHRMWAMLCHLAALAGIVFPFGSIIGPLVVWLIKREDSDFIDRNGKEALNFQISVAIYAIVAGLTIIVLVGIILLPAVFLFSLIMIIVASVKTNNGEHFEYPLCIRFIR
jgi:uncharacterized Tic20 family protein